jgi:GntR family transcriptional regulator
MRPALKLQLRERILAGDLVAGAELPSIRGFAGQHRVSIITVQRAYEDLERAGLIRVLRGKGFFVAEIAPTRRRELAVRRVGEALDPVLSEALAMGLDSEQVQAIVAYLLKEKGGK